MPKHTIKPLFIIQVISVFTFVFGVVSVISGGLVLFIDGSFKKSVGNFVPFIVWFNFMAGFLYVHTGLGLYWGKRWVKTASLFITTATLIVFEILIFYIINGGVHELRTVIAMIFRIVVWGLIIIIAYNLKDDK